MKTWKKGIGKYEENWKYGNYQNRKWENTRRFELWKLGKRKWKNIRKIKSIENIWNIRLDNIRKIGSMETWKIGNRKTSGKLEMWKLGK